MRRILSIVQFLIVLFDDKWKHPRSESEQQVIRMLFDIKETIEQEIKQNEEKYNRISRLTDE